MAGDALSKWADGESRYIVTVEVAVKDADKEHPEDVLNCLDIAIEEGLANSSLADDGVTYIGMSKPVELSDLAEWTMTD